MAARPATIGTRDLAMLRDIGPSISLFLGESPLALSPDGKQIAFQVRQALPDTNSFCLAMMIMPTDGSVPPYPIDSGNMLKRFSFTRGTLAGYPSGDAQLIRPQWSPDGDLVAYLKITSQRTEIQVSSKDGLYQKTLSVPNADITDFRWSARHDVIVVSARPIVGNAQRAIDAEGQKGYLYNDRWAPIGSNRPWPSEDEPPTLVEFDVPSGRSSPSNDPVARELGRPSPVSGSKRLLASAGESVAWIEPDVAERTYSAGKLHFSVGGKSRACSSPACAGAITGIWFLSDGRTLLFSRREGWARNQTALYRWASNDPEPHRFYLSRDLLLGCKIIGKRLLCLREQSLRPRHLVAVDTRTGSTRVLYDPNTEFERLRQPTVERLLLKTDYGSEYYADVVLPPGYDGRTRLPLIVVQYDSRGFLRGGTGDEYPIMPFASEGYAVLSFNRPPNIGPDGPGAKISDIERLGHQDWIDKRNVLDAMRKAVDLLVGRGTVDPTKVGITGLSDGATTLQYALLNTKIFAAASTSTCCEDPQTLFPILGTHEAAWLRNNGYPDYSDRSSKFWEDYSPALNPGRVSVPILMQSADDEYIGALASYTALREHGVPAELYVFPDEHHTKWQPAHKLAVYDRNISWFNFWLSPSNAAEAVVGAEISRWKAMRAAWEAKQPKAAAPAPAPSLGSGNPDARP